ncbi:MAG: hypothetical protein IT453_07330 [Planctomycetes bacterium]|nr:hypothetical protein [Planctomycetota bacterium]
MSSHDFDPHDHAAQRAPARAARRDLLGLSALLGADSGLVPISDLDAGAEFGGAPPRDALEPMPHVCGTCTTRCATPELALVRSENCDPDPKS